MTAVDHDFRSTHVAIVTRACGLGGIGRSIALRTSPGTRSDISRFAVRPPVKNIDPELGELCRSRTGSPHFSQSVARSCIGAPHVSHFTIHECNARFASSSIAGPGGSVGHDSASERVPRSVR